MLDSFRPKKTLREYLDQYADEHKTVGNKVTHMIGIPMIVASLPTMVVAPPVGGTMFVAGWAFQFAGHYYFEKNKPAFFDDPYYLLVGPVWVGIEYAQLLGIPVPEALTGKGEDAPESKTTVVGQAVA
jgi:uncharacterized membrane protein YGL010W